MYVQAKIISDVITSLGKASISLRRWMLPAVFLKPADRLFHY